MHSPRVGVGVGWGSAVWVKHTANASVDGQSREDEESVRLFYVGGGRTSEKPDAAPFTPPGPPLSLSRPRAAPRSREKHAACAQGPGSIPTGTPRRETRDKVSAWAPHNGKGPPRASHTCLTVSTPNTTPHQLQEAAHGTHRHSGDPEAGRSPLGEGNDATARPRAPDRQPGAFQGHHKGPCEARSRTRGDARHGGEGGLPPTLGRGRSRGTHTPKRRKRECPLRQRAPGPQRCHTKLRHGLGGRGGARPEAGTPAVPPTPPAGGGRSSEGPADRTRRADQFTMNGRPSSGAA